MSGSDIYDSIDPFIVYKTWLNRFGKLSKGRTVAEPTERPWGVSVLDGKGAMIVSPSNDEALCRIQAGELFTTRRVALLDASYHTPHEVCIANARLIVESVHGAGGLFTTRDEFIKELAECLHDLLPHAAKRIEQVNELMLGSLYPSINSQKLRRAEELLKKVKEHIGV
jgi:hypothetical protein